MSSSFRALRTVFVTRVLSSALSRRRCGLLTSADCCKEATLLSDLRAMSFSTVAPDVNPLVDEYISLIVDMVFRPKSMNWIMLLASPSAATASAMVALRIQSLFDSVVPQRAVSRQFCKLDQQRGSAALMPSGKPGEQVFSELCILPIWKADGVAAIELVRRLCKATNEMVSVLSKALNYLLASVAVL